MSEKIKTEPIISIENYQDDDTRIKMVFRDSKLIFVLRINERVGIKYIQVVRCIACVKMIDMEGGGIKMDSLAIFTFTCPHCNGKNNCS